MRWLQDAFPTLLAASLSLVLLMGGIAQADIHPSRGPISVGAMLGFSSVSNNVGTGFAIGLDGSYFVNDYWGLGAMLRSANHATDISSFTYAFEGLYRAEDLLPGLQAGAALGATKFSSAGLSDGYNFTYGVKLAYDYRLAIEEPITVGLDLSLMFVKPASVLLTQWTPMLTGKWWF